MKRMLMMLFSLVGLTLKSEHDAVMCYVKSEYDKYEKEYDEYDKRDDATVETKASMYSAYRTLFWILQDIEDNKHKDK